MNVSKYIRHHEKYMQQVLANQHGPGGLDKVQVFHERWRSFVFQGVESEFITVQEDFKQSLVRVLSEGCLGRLKRRRIGSLEHRSEADGLVSTLSSSLLRAAQELAERSVAFSGVRTGSSRVR